MALLSVNLTSSMKLCKGVMRGMMKARWGRIVNISSIVGATGNPGQANYAASKAGMIGMARTWALELAPHGSTVNVVAPGPVQTDNFWGIILGSNNANVVRRVKSYDASAGALTVYGTNLSAESSAMDFELHK